MFLKFLAFRYNNTLIELIKMPKCHIALWLHSEGDAILLTHTHVDSQQLQGDWDDVQKGPHVSVYGEENISQILSLQSEF